MDEAIQKCAIAIWEPSGIALLRPNCKITSALSRSIKAISEHCHHAECGLCLQILRKWNNQERAFFIFVTPASANFIQKYIAKPKKELKIIENTATPR